MRVGMLAPIAWPTPPDGYGPWEQVVATLTDALVELGVDVTLYATGDSTTKARLVSVVDHGYETDRSYDVKTHEALHIATCFEHAGDHDIIHNHFDFLPLTWTRLVPTPVVTTIHGFSSPQILPAYRRYDRHVHYVAISDADRHPDLTYTATIHHGLNLYHYPYRAQPDPDGHLLCFGRIHPDKGTHHAIEIAHLANRPLRIAGIIHDQEYFDHHVRPHLHGPIEYIGHVHATRRADVLGAATALLHPVTFAEPFGLSVIEALACGTPVIAYPRGALPELVRHQHTGYLVDNPAAAAIVLAAIDLINRSNCRHDAEARFTAQHMARRYLTVYEQITRHSRTGDRPSVRRGHQQTRPTS